MSSLRWLSPADAPDDFPSPHAALARPNGLLAAGGDLSPERLLAAYRRGIFPWYEQGQPILWWCPDPRAVLRPRELKISRSLRRSIIKGGFEVTIDTAFDRVVRACAAPRRYASATWITPDMSDAYGLLHRLGWAHSFETWGAGQLVGGVYGVAIGRVFFGESMFSRVTDASKVGLAAMVEHLQTRSFELIDCQVPSQHLRSLGATNMSRADFVAVLDVLCEPRGEPGTWAARAAT
jgi:leucyl/phenylalanyl-tRNA--protein transferase